MKKLIAIAGWVAVVAGGCGDPVAPARRVERGTPSAAAAGAVGDALLFRPCSSPNFDVVYCELKVRNADGSTGYALRATYMLYMNEGGFQSWSPDGSRVAYDAWWDGGDEDWNIDIYAVTIADGSIVDLTNDPAADFDPAWSPDGARIAFLSDRDGAIALYVMNADGSNVTRLAGPAVDGQPAWSPDGSRIAYECVIDPGNYDICAVGSDGSGFTRVTSDPAFDLAPSWSPDGARIAFGTSRFPGSGMQIAVMNADGSNAVQLTSGSSASGQPAWSPSGDRIAFVQFASGACSGYCDSGVYVMNADGSDVTAIQNGSGPVWSAATFVPPPPGDAPPVASFTASCTDLDCSFDANASTDDHQNLSYAWTFGDGAGTTMDITPSHRYADAGTYTVTLTITDEVGQTGTATQTVTVVEPLIDYPPVARMIWSCPTLMCYFSSDGSTDDRAIVSRSWSYGDGTTEGNVVSPHHTYPVGGGTFTVTLVVTDKLGQTGTVSQSVVVVDQPPKARVTASCASGTCTLDARTSSDDGGVTSYRWDLGPYGVSTATVVTVPVAVNSMFTATLTVGDAAGHSNTTTATVWSR